MAQSIMDYVFRRLALDYLDFDTRSYMGIYTAEERARQLETGSYAPVEESDEDVEEELESYAQTAPVVKPKPTETSPETSLEPSSEPKPAGVGDQATDIPADDVKSGAGAASAREVSGVHSSAELLEMFQGKAADAPMCMTCGTKMRPAGSCYVCEGCGSTSGCS
jgi:ribonucleoside-diphosphate reductase alpha chain